MPHQRLTKSFVENLSPPSSGQVLYRDTHLRGFGVRVGPKSKVYFAESQVHRRTVRVTIGSTALVPLDRARKLALKKLGQMVEGVHPNREQRRQKARTTTLRAAFNDYLERRPLAASTLPGYRRTIDLYLATWAKLPLAEINKKMVLDRHRRIGEAHGLVTANNVMRHLRTIYNFALATHDDLPSNPVLVLTQTRSWNPERRRRTFIPQAALVAWYRAVMREPEHSRDFLLVALFTGMRRSEIAKLRWEYIDFAAKTLTIPQTKNGDPLVLPLSNYLFCLLSGRKTAAGEMDWVFPGRSLHCPLTEPKRYTDRVSRTSGVKFTLHDLRRTFVTIAESLDISPYALKRLLNHRVYGDVTAGYIVIDVERLREPVERISSRILEIVSAPEC